METIRSLRLLMLTTNCLLSTPFNPSMRRTGSNGFAKLSNPSAFATFSVENMVTSQTALIITLQSLDGPAVSTVGLEIEPSCSADRVATYAIYFNQPGDRATFIQELLKHIRPPTLLDM